MYVRTMYSFLFMYLVSWKFNDFHLHVILAISSHDHILDIYYLDLFQL